MNDIKKINQKAYNNIRHVVEALKKDRVRRRLKHEQSIPVVENTESITNNHKDKL